MRAYSDKPAEEVKEGAAAAAGKEEGAEAEKIKGLEDKIKSLEVSRLGMCIVQPENKSRGIGRLEHCRCIQSVSEHEKAGACHSVRWACQARRERHVAGCRFCLSVARF